MEVSHFKELFFKEIDLGNTYSKNCVNDNNNAGDEDEFSYTSVKAHEKRTKTPTTSLSRSMAKHPT
jgi:hypothetical protein